MDHDRIGPYPSQFDRIRSHSFEVGLCPADIQANVDAFNPTQAGELLPESRKQRLPHRIPLRKSAEHADPLHPLFRLGSALECQYPTTKKHYEFAPSHLPIPPVPTYW